MSVLGDIAYSPRLYKRGRMAIVIFVMLGLMSFAAVREMAGQCRTEEQYLVTNSGAYLVTNSGARLVTNKKTTRCELTAWGWVRIELSERAVDVLRLGVPVSYI